jgi:hypothetical protein
MDKGYKEQKGCEKGDAGFFIINSDILYQVIMLGEVIPV